MSKIEVNTVEPQCGTTLTLGGSGDTVTLGSGASQSGFGRTGTVDWQTTKKTADFTAANGEGYFIDTSGGAVTMTLPASPSAGDIVAFKDYSGDFSTNNLTIGRNGSNLDGAAGDKAIDTDNTSMSLVYVDATQGWKSVEEGTGFIGESFMVATGGTIVTCGNFKTHIFTGPGTFSVSSLATCSTNNAVDYFVVAGGGGTFRQLSAGGGAGGFRLSNSKSLPAPTTSPLANPSGITVTATDFPITVGAGGSPGPAGSAGGATSGSNSVFSTITSTGGGRGGTSGMGPGDLAGSPGGSGGGGDYNCSSISGGTGNTPPVSPPQGNNGANGNPNSSPPSYYPGGGGGAGAAGSGVGSGNSNGGAGSFIADAFIGPTAPSYGTPGPVSSTRYFAGGGAGAKTPNNGTPTKGVGGGGDGQCGASTPGTVNTGGGGGGTHNPACFSGGGGGSGIVIIRYKFQ